jgi:beta-galactosidase
MKKITRFLSLMITTIFCIFNPGNAQIMHEDILVTSSLSSNTPVLFDFNWRFHRGGALGAERADFDDSAWKKIDLPHDWSIEDLPGTLSPFHPDAVGQVSTGFTTGGTGWYRKSFFINRVQTGKHVIIQFDGIYMNADIWLNGNYLGNHPYGYTSFWYDITEFLKFGEQNILAVQVKNEGQNSRWYTGSGIYRHVWLKITGPIRIAQWGTCITTPEVTADSAKVIIKTRTNNTTDKPAEIALVTKLMNSEGMEKAAIKSSGITGAGKSFEFSQISTINAPDLWSIDSPLLYTAVIEVYCEGVLADKLETPFGIRSVSFSSEKGFLLNGKPIEIKGGCVHHDNGPLGSRAYDRAEERRVELLKSSGFNAIRCAHNPPSPAFLNACDRLGMLVIDEAFDMWINPNNPYDYHLYFEKWWQQDVESMILRDRNHPCIIMWSIGNEIRGMETPEVVTTAHMLADFIHWLEPTRPVTAAVNSVNEMKDPYFAALDIAGYNYARNNYLNDHARKPQRVMYGSESKPFEAFDYWSSAVKYPWVLGDFVWTSFDYIGEASIGWRGYMQEKNFYPWTLAFCGDIDICGWKRPQSHYRDAIWENGNNVSVFVKPPVPSFPVNPKREYWSLWHWQDVVADWNWNGYENKPFEVEVYSSCESVELFLNGKSLGKKETNFTTRYMATWQVPYQPGVLEAVGRNNRKKVTASNLETAGKPVEIRMQADRSLIKANGQDLSYITVELTDGKGIRNPKADNLINFTVTGPGTLVATGNADPMSTESYQQPCRKAWRGRCLVIVKSEMEKGKITVCASVDGIKSSEIIITSVD